MERHDTLLITSSSAENRAHLRDVLGEGFNLLEADNARQTLLLLKQNSSCIAALLLRPLLPLLHRTAAKRRHRAGGILV